MTRAEGIMQNQLFKDVSPVHMAKVMLCTKEQNFPEGKRLFSEGDQADYLYLIQEGYVNLTFSFDIGNVETEIAIDTKGKRECVGWSALIDPHIYTLSCRSRSPVLTLAVEGGMLLSICKEEPDFGYRLMRNISKLVGGRMRQMQTMFIQEIKRGVSMP